MNETWDRRAYKPDLKTRIAIERSKRDQPPLLVIASKVPANYSAVRDRSEGSQK